MPMSCGEGSLGGKHRNVPIVGARKILRKRSTETRNALRSGSVASSRPHIIYRNEPNSSLHTIRLRLGGRSDGGVTLCPLRSNGYWSCAAGTGAWGLGALLPECNVSGILESCDEGSLFFEFALEEFEDHRCD